MGNYLEDLKRLTEEREELNQRTSEIYQSRGLNPALPLIALVEDPAAMQLVTDWEAHQSRDAAFFEKYLKPGVDPHTI